MVRCCLDNGFTVDVMKCLCCDARAEDLGSADCKVREELCKSALVFKGVKGKEIFSVAYAFCAAGLCQDIN